MLNCVCCELSLKPFTGIVCPHCPLPASRTLVRGNYPDRQKAPPGGRPHGFPYVAPLPRRPSWLPRHNHLPTSSSISLPRPFVMRLSLSSRMGHGFYLFSSLLHPQYLECCLAHSSCSISIDWRISLDWYLLRACLHVQAMTLSSSPCITYFLDGTDNLLLY